MRKLTGLLVILTALAAPVRADAPDTSLRPVPRPAEVGALILPDVKAAAFVMSTASVGGAPERSLRPVPHRRVVAPPVSERGETGTTAFREEKSRPLAALLSTLRPTARPDDKPDMTETVQPAAAIRVLPGKSAVFGRKGSVCGVNGIRGEALAPITSRVQGCGIREPVRVTSVDGVQLSMAATLDCSAARALHDWVRGGLKPAFGRSEVVQLQIAAHYACRPRNNVKGAKVSEHGRGKAIDISAIVLKNGKTVSVLDDWRTRAGRPMVRAYRAACGTFGTTLGPDADRHHRNHLHFDTARHGNGAYCR